MSSGAHLVRALERIGFKQVERHAQPQPLLSWRGQPVGVDAEIIVRRSQIGATADDLGFTRGANGKFEALVSNILLSRLDRRWFEKLSEHYEAAVAEDGGAPQAPDAPYSAPATASPAAHAESPAAAPSERRSERTTRREFEPAPRRESERGPRNESERVPRGESERREQGGPAPSAPERAPKPRPEEFKTAVREAVDAVIAAPATAAAAAAGAAAPELKREIGAVLAVARAAGGGGMGRSCMVHLALWFGLVVLSAFVGSAKPLLFGSFVLVFLFVKKANERRKRMVDAALAELRTRLRYDVELRAQVLRELRRTLEEQSGEMRPLVQDLVKRIETSPLK